MLLMVSRNRLSIESTHRILRQMHASYLETHGLLYSQEERHWLQHYLNSLIQKSFLTRVAIEQMQAVRYGAVDASLLEAIERGGQDISILKDEEVVVSFALEAFLFEARAFLDVYMIFVCLLLKTGFQKGHMSVSRFFEELDKPKEPPFGEKAKGVKRYFETRVFGPLEERGVSVIRNDWGTLLRGLRDRVAHRDIVVPSFESGEILARGVRLDWPTVQGLTFHSLAETVGNGIHGLFQEVLSYIYEVDWDDYHEIHQQAT